MPWQLNFDFSRYIRNVNLQNRLVIFMLEIAQCFNNSDDSCQWITSSTATLLNALCKLQENSAYVMTMSLRRVGRVSENSVVHVSPRLRSTNLKKLPNCTFLSETLIQKYWCFGSKLQFSSFMAFVTSGHESHCRWYLTNML